jgi:hypothetical protein
VVGSSLRFGGPSNFGWFVVFRPSALGQRRRSYTRIVLPFLAMHPTTFVGVLGFDPWSPRSIDILNRMIIVRPIYTPFITHLSAALVPPCWKPGAACVMSVTVSLVIVSHVLRARHLFYDGDDRISSLLLCGDDRVHTPCFLIALLFLVTCLIVSLITMTF